MLTSILLLIIIFSSCRTPRYLPDAQALVTRVNLKGIDKRFSEQALLYVQKDVRPNSRLNLLLYNTFNTKGGRYRTDRIKDIGEAPHILDSSLVEISRIQIEKFFKNKGYFRAHVKSDILIKNKKAKITFTADQGPEFKIRNIQYIIPDSVVSKLYSAKHNFFTHLHSGSRYDADSLNYEREQIFQMMKENGYYDYVRQFVRFEVDSTLYNNEADLKMSLSNPKGGKVHQIYTIDNSIFTIKNSDGLMEGLKKDTVLLDTQYHIIDYSLKFKPKIFRKYSFIKKGELYNLSKENLTYDRLYDLNVFKNVKIEYVKSADSTFKLSPRYDIIPLKKMSNRIEGEFTFNSGRNGFNFGDTYSNRNLFGGAELLEIKAKYGIQFDATASGNIFNRIFSRDFQLGANIIVPKLLVPFKIPQLGKNGIPHTTISSSIQLFDQVNAFSSRIVINSITYDWVETKAKLHSLTPLNIEYRKGVLDPAFKSTLQTQGYELYIRTNDREFFNLGSLYSYTVNTIKLNTYDNFLYFRGSIDAAGNSLGLFNTIFKFKTNDDGFKTIFGLPYQQYVKTEIDLRLYRHLGGESQFVARLNPGIGIPYGNSSTLTFEKNFFAGGSSGVRAWQARTLGPGNYNRAVLANDALRTNLRNLDQLGEIKLEGNLEYRFKVLDNLFGAKIKGATFTDFGNVWRLHESVENPGGEFKFNKFLGQLAVGAGAGLRIDLNYFVFRLDAGIKVKDPQFSGSDQWVIKHLFNYSDFKSKYAASNKPDVYRFVQYNFGIGMPF